VKEAAVVMTVMTATPATAARVTTTPVHVTADLQVADVDRGADASGVGGAGARAESKQESKRLRPSLAAPKRQVAED